MGPFKYHSIGFVALFAGPRLKPYVTVPSTTTTHPLKLNSDLKQEQEGC